MSGNASPPHAYAHSYASPQPHDAVTAGLRSVVEALNSGALSEEQAVDLIKVLATAYAGELISQRIGDYLEGGLSHILGHQIEEWKAVGGRQ